MKWIIFIVLGIVLLVLYVISNYNKLMKLNMTVNEAFSTMDIYLKKRWDLVPNLVATVKGYTKHEMEAFSEIIRLRSSSYNNMNMEDKVELENKVSAAIPQIFALSESYPELKANENFLELNKSLAKIEEDISQSRKYYNGTVKKFNTAVSIFPSNIIAGIFNFKAKTLFEINSNERDVVNVSFE